MGRGVFLGQPRYCIYTNASRGLSTIAEFLVSFCNTVLYRSRFLYMGHIYSHVKLFSVVIVDFGQCYLIISQIILTIRMTIKTIVSIIVHI